MGTCTICLFQVKLEVSHHQTESNGDFKSSKSLAFVLDEKTEKPEGSKKGKKKANGSLTSKNFGSAVNVSKLKSSPSLIIAWRCRSLALENKIPKLFQNSDIIMIYFYLKVSVRILKRQCHNVSQLYDAVLNALIMVAKNMCFPKDSPGWIHPILRGSS